MTNAWQKESKLHDQNFSLEMASKLGNCDAV